MEDNKLRAVSYCLYTSSNPDWEIVGNYEETEFDTMLEDAKNGKFDIILTKSISQFSENVVELLTIVRDLRQHDVAVYFEEESINTSALNSELLLTVFAELKEVERMVC